jgi:uncharacterized protein YndB with AHSA1/START domain
MSGTIHLARTLRASHSEIGRACTTAAGLQTWYADRVTGEIARGGSVVLAWPDLGASIELEVTDLVPERRVTFENGTSTVTLEVSAETVTLEHSGLEDEDDLEGFRSSWQIALAVLGHAVEVHRGAARRARWVARPARVSPGVAHAWFTEPRALAAWLGEGAVVGGVGEGFSLSFGDGEPMSGRVLGRAEGRDIAWSWKERDDSVVVLRTLPGLGTGNERVLAACWSTWAPADDRDGGVVRDLSRALERLAGILETAGRA